MMENEIDEPTPLLMLTDECLLDIFQLLEFKDCVRFANTCIRLRNIARLNKFKKINVYTATCNFGFDSKNMVSKDEFIKIMSLIGEHVLSIHVFDGLNDVFEIIGDNCQNLKSLKVSSRIWVKPIHLRNFHNLKELNLNAMFHDNFKFLPDIENNIIDLDLSEVLPNFKCEKQREGFLELLDRLPKLKSLNLGYVNNMYYLHSREFLFRINGIISFSFASRFNYNYLLKKLLNLNLVKLSFQMELNANSFDIIQQFQNLEVLVMVQSRQMQEMQFPETAVFPPYLKHVKIDNIFISWNKLSSIVEKAKYLEVIDLGSKGRILFDHHKCKFSYQNNMLQNHVKLLYFS